VVEEVARTAVVEEVARTAVVDEVARTAVVEEVALRPSRNHRSERGGFERGAGALTSTTGAVSGCG
jgi:hypothetical protein